MLSEFSLGSELNGVGFKLELAEGVEGGAGAAVFEIGGEDSVDFEMERIPREGGGSAVGGLRWCGGRPGRPSGRGGHRGAQDGARLSLGALRRKESLSPSHFALLPHFHVANTM